MRKVCVCVCVFMSANKHIRTHVRVSDFVTMTFMSFFSPLLCFSEVKSKSSSSESKESKRESRSTKSSREARTDDSRPSTSSPGKKDEDRKGI